MQITNTADINLALAVWLMHDDYDYVDEPNYISATRLMRPIRHIVLPKRIPYAERTADVQDYIARALGHSIHDSIEKAWVKGYVTNLKKLGYENDLIDRVKINPTNELRKNNPDIIPVYIEQRALREFEGYTIGGKFDMVAEGIVHDNKSTSAYTWLYGTRDEENQLQGSLYRWIDSAQPMPKITEDFMRVNYIFTDWSKLSAKTNPAYPQKRVEQKELPLLSLKQTEEWVRDKLSLVQKYIESPEHQIPECTDEELWRSTPSFKYYADPNKTDGRSTKNFDTLREANAYLAEKVKGIVITKAGEVKRCGYCDAFDVCTQKDRYI